MKSVSYETRTEPLSRRFLMLMFHPANVQEVYLQPPCPSMGCGVVERHLEIAQPTATTKSSILVTSHFSILKAFKDITKVFHFIASSQPDVVIEFLSLNETLLQAILILISEN